MRDRIPRLVEAGAVEQWGRGRGRQYLLSRSLYASLGRAGAYTRKRGLDRETNKALLMQHLTDSGAEGAPIRDLLQVLPRDDPTPSLDLESVDEFDQLLAPSVHYRIATGPYTGRKALTLRTVASNPFTDNPCIAQSSGFSLHAGTRCQIRERNSLERMCRYIARPALSNERLSVNDPRQVVYRLMHSFRDGTTHVVLDPIDFIARLAALVPRPRVHLTRYHGVFAPNFKHRHRIVANPAHQAVREPLAPRPPPMSWMQRLQRVFHIDIERCGVCGGTLRIIACIHMPEVIERILTHLAARETGCINDPRAPPLRAPNSRPLQY